MHLDLVRAGIISEPLSSDNEARAGWVAWSDWHLETKVMWPRENNSDSFTSVGFVREAAIFICLHQYVYCVVCLLYFRF